MSDHEFEKQVRQKLNDLKITPSAQAWENIEERLRERRRRKPLLWLPLLLAGIAAGGYYFSSHSWPFNNAPVTSATGLHRLAPEGKNIAEAGGDRNAELDRNQISKSSRDILSGEDSLNKNVPSNDGHPDKSNGVLDKHNIKNNDSDKNIDGNIHSSVTGVSKQSDETDKQRSANKSLLIFKSRSDKNKFADKADISSNKNINGNRYSLTGVRTQSSKSDKKDSGNGYSLVSPLHSDLKSTQQKRGQKQIVPSETANTFPKELINSQQNKTAAGKTTSPNSAGSDIVSRQNKPAEELANQPSPSLHEPSDSVQSQGKILPPQGKNLPPILSQAPVNNNITAAPVTKTVSKVSGSKWSYAVNLYTGVSMINKNALSSKKSMLQNAEYPQNAFAAVVASYAPVYKPGVTSPGFTLSAGVDVKRELSKRFSLAAGLDYTQINTFLKAGEQYTSTLSAYGLRGYLLSNAAMVQNEIKVYKNRYHFIDLPLTLHTRLNNSTRLPLFWDAGIVVSRLLGSASAHFDPSNGLYYSDDSLVNKTQAGLMTGFSIALFNRTKHPLWVGPSVRSNISSVLKNNASDARHFVTFGLDLKFFLKN